MLDELVTSLGKVGLKVNAAKTDVLTTQARPRKILTTRVGLEIGVLDQSSSHKWLGCMLSTARVGKRHDDVDHQLQSAALAFHFHNGFSVTKWFQWHIVRNCLMLLHRWFVLQLGTRNAQKLDAHCRKLFRRVVRPPTEIDWNEPWHTILHTSQKRHLRTFLRLKGSKKKINDWNTMVSKYGQQNICVNIGKYNC